MKISIQANSAKLTQEEILSALPASAKEALKGKTAVAYVIAEEGESRPRVIGQGNSVLRWPRAVIKRVAEAAQQGVKFFSRHNKDNSHDGRPTLGEVVGSFTRQVGDKLQAIAVGVVDAVKEELDVCSIEADVQVSEGIVGDVDAVTGIALSSSKVDSPAFAGAQRLAILQCFAEETKPTTKEIRMPTFEEVRDFVRSHNVYPRQLFSMEDIKNDREFGPVLLEADTLKQKVTTLTQEKTELEKRSADAIRKADIVSAREQFEKLIPSGATEKQKAFYKQRFDPERLEKLDEAALKAHLDNEAKAYAETAKLFGITEIEPKPGDGEQNKKADDGNALDAAFNEIVGGTK